MCQYPRYSGSETARTIPSRQWLPAFLRRLSAEHRLRLHFPYEVLERRSNLGRRVLLDEVKALGAADKAANLER
jgi:hypothetical protein